MAAVTVKSLQNLQQVVVTADHAFIADEPAGVGDGLGPNPYDLLLAALGTCTAMTILMYVRRKGWPLRSVTVECDHERVHGRDSESSEEQERAHIEVIRRRIEVEGDLDDEQRDRLAYIAARCPVRRTLQGGPRIEDSIEVV